MVYGDFDLPLTAYEVEGVLTNVSPLAVGSGRGVSVSAVDNPVVRDERGLPYIPASSLKGVARAEAERYARSIGERVCNILDLKGEEGELTWQSQEGDNHVPCVVCRIFGGPTIASHLVFRDARLLSVGFEKISEVRRRVSISRVTGGQHPGKLYDYEYIVPGHRFGFYMKVEGIDLTDSSVEAEILRYLLRLLVDGRVQVGGGRSVGLGFVRLEIERVLKVELVDGRIKTEDVKSKLASMLKGGVG